MVDNKDLQNVLEQDSKSKDLDELLCKFENSYICKGLDYITQKLRISGHYSDSRLAKAIDATKNAIFYSTVLGLMLGNQQEKYAEHLGHDKFKFMKYSLAFGVLVPAAKVAAALISPGAVAVSLYAWAGVTFGDTVCRVAYSAVKKKPIGSLVYVEGPYKLFKAPLRILKNMSNKLPWKQKYQLYKK